MSFQAYLDTIKKQTGMEPQQIYGVFSQQDKLSTSLSATDWVLWCAQTFKLGRGHAMALWKYFVEKGWLTPAVSRLKK